MGNWFRRRGGGQEPEPRRPGSYPPNDIGVTVNERYRPKARHSRSVQYGAEVLAAIEQGVVEPDSYERAGKQVVAVDIGAIVAMYEHLIPAEAANRGERLPHD